MKKISTGAAAMLLLASCMQGSEVKPTAPGAPGPTTTVSGTVLEPDGKPAANAAVKVLADGHWGGRHDYADTDAAGKFALQGVPQGKVVLYAAKGAAVGHLQLAAPSAGEVVVQLKAPGSLSGAVKSRDGAQVLGGSIYFSERGTFAGVPSGGQGNATFAGDHFQLDSIPSGDGAIFVVVKADEHSKDRSGVLDFHLDPGQHAEVSVEVDTSTASLTATVLDAATGKPMEAKVLLLEADGTPQAYWKSEPDTGSSTFIKLAAGDRILLIQKVGYATQQIPVSVPAGKDVDAGKIAMVMVDPAAAKQNADERAAEKAAEEKAAADKAAREAAEKLAKAVISTSSNSPDAIAAFKLGFEWVYSGHGTRGFEQLQKAVAADANFLLAQSYLAAFTPGAESMKKVTAAADAGSALPDAERTELQLMDAVKKADYAKYDELNAKLVALAPGDWRAQFLAGTRARQARKLDEAAAFYQRAADLNPQAFLPHSALAAVANLKGDHATEIAEYQKAAALLPGEPALQDDLAGAMISAGKFDDAAKAIDAELAMTGAGWEAHSSLSVVDLLRGDLAAALKEALASRELAKDPDDHLQQHGHVLFTQLIMKKHADALKTAAVEEKEAKGVNPNFVIEAGINKALVLIDEKKFPAAIASLTETLARVDTEGLSGVRRAAYRRDALSLLGWAHATAGKADGAQLAMETLVVDAGNAAATNSDIASTIAFAQGQALLAKGDSAGAVAAMSKCEPEDDLCRWALSNAQEKSGDHAGASATRAAVLALNHADDRGLWVRARISAPGKAAKAAKTAKPAAPSK